MQFPRSTHPYLWTQQGWLYLAVVIDLHSRRIVGWSMDRRMHKALVVRALLMAIKLRKPPPGLIHHSDSEYMQAGFFGCSDPHSDRSDLGW